MLFRIRVISCPPFGSSSLEIGFGAVLVLNHVNELEGGQSFHGRYLLSEVASPSIGQDLGHVIPAVLQLQNPQRFRPARELFVRRRESMTREESETVIRRLVEEWIELGGVTEGQSGAPSFSDFYAWLQQDYSPYLEFRSATSIRADVERWFNEELGQDWLNSSE